MINILQKELDQLNKKQKTTQSCINDLFFSVQENYLRQLSINHPILPNPNLIIKVRPEIVNLIFAYLDYSSFLQFRLVSQKTNNQIVYLLSLKLNSKQQQLQIKQLELKQAMENHPEIDEQTLSLLLQYQQSKDVIKSMRRQDRCELSTMRFYPPIIQIVFSFLNILLIENYVEQQDRWYQTVRLVNDCQFFNQLLNFDVLSITDNKLLLLQNITTMEEKLVQSSSYIVYCIFKHIHILVTLRQQPQYKIIFQIGQIRQEVNKQQQCVDKLQKIVG